MRGACLEQSQELLELILIARLVVLIGDLVRLRNIGRWDGEESPAARRLQSGGVGGPTARGRLISAVPAQGVACCSGGGDGRPD